jgi:cytochrome c5
MSLRRAVICSCAVLLAACGQGAAPPATAEAIAAAAAAAPSDPKLARLYGQTCKTCHAVPGTGAPLTRDAAAWAPRVAQGMPLLLDHTLNGYKGMPPLGSCSDCTEAEFTALIQFMSGQAP